jgi:hypothetical protein
MKKFISFVSQKMSSLFGGTGVSIQGFMLAKQMLYWSSHTSSPFCFG